ncbi:MAG: 50S ribosomal protein L18 [Alphaproteobacteria bacterium]
MANTKKLFERRRMRVRSSLRKNAKGSPRLSIHRTGLHMYAQVIDDVSGKTLASASTLEKDLKGKAQSSREGAGAVGKLIAERAKKAGIKKVVFDRGGFIYHGRVKALADAAREAGLDF